MSCDTKMLAIEAVVHLKPCFTTIYRDDISRPVGTNDVGMLAWSVHMKTPEYPEGRDIVIVANDVTVQSGEKRPPPLNVPRGDGRVVLVTSSTMSSRI